MWEHNGEDSLLYSLDYIGTYIRGESKEKAKEKMQNEITNYLTWLDIKSIPKIEVEIVQEKVSNLCIKDADSDVIFEEERKPLSMEEYLYLKNLVLKSANDFLSMYTLSQDKNISTLPKRDTFYGLVPRTSQEMYYHTKNDNSYYFG